MPISPGSKLGPYEILSLLGAGGMGEVYRARDPRLGRDVAIKVLPADRMTDEDRRLSFIREAQAASALNHPNIVTVHEVDSVDGIDFVVMEYVAGKTLGDAIPSQGMRLDQVLQVGLQIADALARAHAAGIVHRDVKPANVVVSAEGTVKVLDFGLAKLITPERTSASSETEPDDGALSKLNRPGKVAGTIGYMSPEQAAGGEVDARSDVFSFGALLYEMATGRRAFAGSSTAEVLAALMREQPRPPGEVVPELPQELDRLIRRCLRKDPGRRYQCVLDVKVELQEIRDEAESGRAAPAKPRRRQHLRWLGAGLVAAVLVAAATWSWRRDRGATLEAPRLAPPVTSMRGEESSPTLSPDGEQVAFEWSGDKLANPDIYLKIVGSSDIRRLTTDPAPDVAPSWSPDGKQIAFVRVGPHAVGRIHLVSPLGGSDRKLSDFPHAGGSPSWSPDGRWLAVARARSAQGTGPLPYLPGSDGLYLLPVNGGEPRAIELPQGVEDSFNPKLAPDGRHLAYLSCVGSSCHVAVVDLGFDYVPTGAPRRLTRRPVWLFGGLTWTRDGQSLLYVEHGIHRLWRVGITGDRAPEIVEMAGLGVCCAATAASRDRLVFVKELYNGDIYRFEVGRPPEPLLTSSFEDDDPQFSPDGRRVVFESERSGEHEIWLAEADGSIPMPLTHGPGVAQGSPRWSPDGRRIGFDSQADDGGSDIWTIDADGASPRRLTQGPGDKHMLSWSRDGRSIYFASRPEDALQRIPSAVWRVPEAGGAAERITQGGGGLAYESIDGRTLFFMRRYLEYSPLFALPLAGGPERKISECVSTFAVGPAGLYSLECSDGQRTSLVVRDPGTGRGRLLGQLDRSDFNGLTVSPDAKTFLYTRVVGEGSDLMMIENFR